MVFFGLGEHNFRDIELKFYIFFITSCYLAIKFENTGLKNDNFLVFNLSEFISNLGQQTRIKLMTNANVKNFILYTYSFIQYIHVNVSV